MLTQEQRQQIEAECKRAFGELFCRAGDDITEKVLNNAIKNYAQEFDRATESPALSWSYTMRRTGKVGFLITTKALYAQKKNEPAEKAMLSEIVGIKAGNTTSWHGESAIVDTKSGKEIELHTIGGFPEGIAVLTNILAILGADVSPRTPTPTSTETAPTPQPSQIPSNCTNCSAVMPKGQNTCEYCGTTYN